MKFTATALPGVFVVQQERHEDARGWFARSWCQREAKAHGINVEWVQSNVSFNARRGTLRGLHYQAAPHEEPKLVTCMSGRMFDVAVDVRQDSPTYLKHVAVELDPVVGNSLFIPAGFAHGFQTLTDNVTVLYQMGAFFEPGASRGIRFDDSQIGIAWPVADRVVSERDGSFGFIPGGSS